MSKKSELLKKFSDLYRSSNNKMEFPDSPEGELMKSLYLVVHSLEEWAIETPSWIEQYRCEAQAVRKHLGYTPDDQYVSPKNLKQSIDNLIEGSTHAEN